MNAIERYSLTVKDRETGTSLLIREGRTVAEVEGVKLEAQYELSNGSFLIWLTDDSPYDEGLHIYLLEKDEKIDDALEAGAKFGMGNPGILKISTIGTNWVEFQFFLNDTVYRIEITPDTAFRMRLPAGWRYKRLFSRHRMTIKER